MLPSASSGIGLAEELWQIILSFIDSKEDISTVCALRATNKRLQALVQPIFRCEVSFKYDGSPYSKDEIRIATHLQRRIMELAKVPELARVIQGVVMEESREKFTSDDIKHPEVKVADFINDYKSRLADSLVSRELAQELTTEMRLFEPAAFLAFMIAVCPNIDRLHLQELNTSSAEVLYYKVIHDAVAGAQPAWLEQHLPSRPLQNLKALTLSFRHGAGLSEILPLLVLPKLSYYSVSGMGDTPDHWDHRVPPPLQDPERNTNAIELVLDDTMLSGKGLGCLLQSCVQPRALTIRWRAGLWNEHFKNESIGWAVRRFGQTLEYLHIDSINVVDARFFGEQATGCFGSFQSLIKLRTLAVPGYAFWNPPRSVQAPGGDENDIDGEDAGGGQDHSNHIASDLEGAWDENEGPDEIASEIASNIETTLTVHEEVSGSHDNEPVPANDEILNTIQEHEDEYAGDEEVDEQVADQFSEEEPLSRVNSGADEQTIRQAYPISPTLSAQIDSISFDALELNELPTSLERIYILGSYPDHYVYRPRSDKFRYVPHIYESEIEALRHKISNDRADSSPRLKIRTIPFSHYWIWDHGGKNFHRHVDYNQITEWPEQRLKHHTDDGDGTVQVY